MAANSKSDAVYCVIAVLSGVLAGTVHVGLQDPLVTALIVLASTMILGFVRPKKPWRWTLLVGLVVPCAMVIAWTTGHFSNFTRAALYGSSLVILPGFAGAYGGYFGQRVIKEIFPR